MWITGIIFLRNNIDQYVVKADRTPKAFASLIPPAALRLRAPPVHVATGGHGPRSANPLFQLCKEIIEMGKSPSINRLSSIILIFCTKIRRTSEFWNVRGCAQNAKWVVAKCKSEKFVTFHKWKVHKMMVYDTPRGPEGVISNPNTWFWWYISRSKPAIYAILLV